MIGEEQILNRGYRIPMIQTAIKHYIAYRVSTGMLIDPQTTTAAYWFIERLGFEFMGLRVFPGDCCFVYELRKMV
ncbi:hypothetical protein [Rhodohalobacter mucosus]|uniref:hypothetical protein n=1 Tax=Rhodohalobacter mucosus TaxID=2079485 RepID=UPI0011B21C0D|nr:hypothetical protein [Rhodohalobacter mucosus]